VLIALVVGIDNITEAVRRILLLIDPDTNLVA
jgi:hypothetical protein